MKEIPHKWFFCGLECKMLGPILNEKNEIVGLRIEQSGDDWFIPMNSDGSFDPRLGYELIN